jgi:type I restriction enzyme S subunit
MEKYGLTEKETELLKSAFEKFPQVETVFIYGSRAKNTFRKTSDIDLAVRFKNGNDASMAQLKSALDDFPIIHEIDLTDESKIQSGDFKNEYERTKQIFYIKGWKNTMLGDVADVNISTIDKNYIFDEIEYIDVASVEERKLTETQKLKLENSPSRAKRIVGDNSILISTVRPNLKHYCFVKKAKPNLVASTGFAVVNSKEGKSDPYFLYNLLTTSDYTDYLSKIADSQTTAYPAFNSSIIQDSKFKLPPFPEQRAIAAVLSSLDDKIELLREQNKTLEATAQAIFKEWFVNFNLPAVVLTKAGFPDGKIKMIDSELGKIPEGWRVGNLTELFDFIKGIEPGSHNYSVKKLSEDYLPFYRVQDTLNYNKTPNVFVDKRILNCHLIIVMS